MSIRDQAIRDAIKAEFERAFSPRAVQIEWDFGDLLYRIEGLEHARIPTAHLSWGSAIAAIKRNRGDLRRKGEKLDDWSPPLPPTLS